MFDAFVWSVFVFLILLGTVAFCYIIMLKLLLQKSDRNYYIFIPCNQNTTKIREKAYSTRLKLSLLGEDLYGKVVILDCGITDKEKEEITEISKEYNGIYCIRHEDIKEFFDGRIWNKNQVKRHSDRYYIS